MKKEIFCLLLMAFTYVGNYAQDCAANWTYDDEYELETGLDGAFNIIYTGYDDVRWNAYFGTSNFSSSYVSLLPILGNSDKRSIWLPRVAGANDNEVYYKGATTYFYISDCASTFDMQIRFQFRNFNEGLIFINDNPTPVASVEGHNMGDPAQIDHVSYLHTGVNKIHVRFKDKREKGDDNDKNDNDTYFFLNAYVTSDKPIYCIYDQNYIASLDSDGDGVKDIDEPQKGDFICNPGEWENCDTDGIGNNADPDDDNDGVLDVEDAFPCDNSEWTDSDEDGIGDNADPMEGDCCKTFQPKPGERYWLSAWVKEDLSNRPPQKSYWRPIIKVDFLDNEEIISDVSFYPSGEIIDGWQRIVGELPIPVAADRLNVNLINRSENTSTGFADVYFDDIRIHPFNGSMKSFVYDPETLWLSAELDDNNYATFYEYDNEGQLIRIKKETARGIMTIQESRSKLTNSLNNH